MTLGIEPGQQALDERQTADGRRKITLRRSEREQLQELRKIQRAATLFLDIEQHRTWEQIAGELDMTRQQLKALTRMPEFELYYNELFIEIGEDPRYKAAKQTITDMIPLAVMEHKGLLTNPGTAAGVKLNAIKEVYRIAGIDASDLADQEREVLANFLRSMGLQEDTPPLPEDFVGSEEQFFGEDIIEGEYEDVPAKGPQGGEEEEEN